VPSTCDPESSALSVPSRDCGLGFEFLMSLLLSMDTPDDTAGVRPAHDLAVWFSNRHSTYHDSISLSRLLASRPVQVPEVTRFRKSPVAGNHPLPEITRCRK